MWRSDIGLGGSGGGRVWRDCCAGWCLGVDMVVLSWVECGWCLLWPWRVCLWVLVLCLFQGLGQGQAGCGLMGQHTSGLSHMRHLASYFILSVVIVVISPFCQIQFSFSRGKNYKEKEKSSGTGTGTNFHLAVEKGCVQ